jgi:F-type H+-transporting ATPase subunit b
MVAEAKVKATEEAERIMANAKLEIENQKKVAISEVKNQSSLIALAIAERVIKKQLTDNEDQETLANELIDNIKLS